MGKSVTTLDFMRHGEPVGGNKYRGRTDDPLSDKGWEQMRRAVADHSPWSVIVSSPLTRCADFARELAQRHGLPLEMDPRLMELGFGAWEGKTSAELTRSDPEILARFWSDPLAHTPPGGEPLAAFRERVVAVWGKILETHSGEHVLIVAHAGVIRMAISHVLGTPLKNHFRMQVPNAGISRIRVETNGESNFPQLLFHAGSL
jgi:alpha-ribazole phosphatase